MTKQSREITNDSSKPKRPEIREFGIRFENGEWRPPYPCSYAPLFEWPPRPGRILKWLFGYPGYLWPVSLVLVALACITWFLLQPDLAKSVDLKVGWIGLMFLRNIGLIWIVYGGLHLVLYKLKLHGSERKYFPKWQAADNKRFLFKNQVFDNVFRSCISGGITWTVYEVLYIWAASNQRIPLLDIKKNPVWFIALFLIIPLWRELHFYLTHRMIHWKPLFRKIHVVHHLNHNPGPWAGLAMHTIEHILYFSVVAVHFIVPSHPVHFFFNSLHTALTPANGHHGFEGPLFNGWLKTGSYFHYLHHRYVTCNLGESTIPLDRWFGRFYDGTGKYRSKLKTQKTG